jgi:DNA-binding XRE family transcriptional regulator
MLPSDSFWFMAIQTGSRQIHLRLRELRIQAGLSPNDLAYKARVSGKTVRMAEAGFIPLPRTQFAIAGVFELTPLDLWPLRRERQEIAA